VPLRATTYDNIYLSREYIEHSDDMSESSSKISGWKSSLKSLGKKRKFASSGAQYGEQDTALVGSRERYQQDAGTAPQSTNPSSSMPYLRGTPGEAMPGNSTQKGTFRRTKRPRVSGTPDQEETAADAPVARVSTTRTEEPSHETAKTMQSFFWAQARESFERKNEKRIVELMKMGEDRVDAALELQKLLDERKRSNKGVSPTVDRAVRNILVYKDISVAAATFDPTRAAPTIVRGICTILQV
jgi:hypothetical protein